MRNSGRKLNNAKPAAAGKGCSPAEYLARKGYTIDPKTGLRVYHPAPAK